MPRATRSTTAAQKVKQEPAPTRAPKRKAPAKASKATTTKAAPANKRAKRAPSTPTKQQQQQQAAVGTPTGLKGVAPPSQQPAGAIDAGFHDQTSGKHARNGTLVSDARLVQVEPRTNTDKYYIIQLVKAGRSHFCWQRWGRTGTSGQGALHTGTAAEMQALFESKFAEKTGMSWSDAQNAGAAPLPGKYRWIKTAGAAMAAAAAAAARWEYYVNDGVDGKQDGWYPYDAQAVPFMEEVFRDAHLAHNANMTTRFVDSGNFTYKVDLASAQGAFTQTNTRTNKVRQIRRVQGNAVTTAANSPVQPQQQAKAKAAVAARAPPSQTPPRARKKAAAAASASAAADDDDEESDEELDTTSLHPVAQRLIPGGTIVDGHKATLNQTDIKNGANNNKFYNVEAIQSPSGDYTCLTVWGRVGEPGQHQLFYCGGDKEACIRQFKSKFKDKTGNNWEDRKRFVKKNKKYDLVLTKAATPTPKRPAAAGNRAHAPSKLDPATQDFLEFIFSKDMLKASMAELQIDTEKMPLGALTRRQVESAYAALDALDAEINGAARRSHLEDLTSRYYTVMPHNFGRSKPPIITTAAELQREYDLVNVVADVEAGQALERESEAAAGKLAKEPHPLDAKFAQLNMDDWTVVANNSALFKKLETYASASKSHRNVRLVRAFQVARGNGEHQRFGKHDGLERALLWHGTNVAVVAAILKSGLRIMPHSGGRVGAGIYLASEHAKSLGYTRGAVHRGKQQMVMFLVEAALGKPKEIVQDDSSLRAPPKGHHSVFARGRRSPFGVKDETLTIEGRPVTLPLGAPRPTEFSNSSFHQDELLIYDESQHRLRFVLVFEA